MEEVTQIRVGEHMTGIIGLKETLAAVADECRGLPDAEIAEILLARLAVRNYISDNVREAYACAFLRAYKKAIGAPVPENDTSALCIKVLGPGCVQCERLAQDVMAVMAEMNIMADLVHVRDVMEIGRYGVMGMPALVINEGVVWAGSVPPKSKITAWIAQAGRRTKS